ncbi:hypothetical protein EYF80_052148 [Liparis tanakae]|uniref:Uncharacterized protein n=1 Tax=Liparis tanakae TaxID=230148 RepID=A0A4Z2F943_9TELE|nr:hypothetical protein EYF80_052148 [Liparis tanakae]
MQQPQPGSRTLSAQSRGSGLHRSRARTSHGSHLTTGPTAPDLRANDARRRVTQREAKRESIAPSDGGDVSLGGGSLIHSHPRAAACGRPMKRLDSVTPSGGAAARGTRHVGERRAEDARRHRTSKRPQNQNQRRGRVGADLPPGAGRPPADGSTAERQQECQTCVS